MGRGTGIISYLRGKVFVIDQPAYYAGINPAYAGKRIMACVCTQSTQDHPRPCGEKSSCVIHPLTTAGSPPPMRGKVGQALASSAAPGITPAHAGKSLAIRLRGQIGEDHPRPCGEIARTSTWSRDHPRPCGEKDTRSLSAVPAQGSPPPMRGKDMPCRWPKRGHRITPAHAGKRKIITPRISGMRDHPRPCGEKAAAIDDICLRLGSPPPMRGKAVGMADRAAALGITPAHAGKRYVRIKRESPSQDHPRPCGEKQNSSTKISSNLGSPPPMRGKVFAKPFNAV